MDDKPAFVGILSIMMVLQFVNKLLTNLVLQFVNNLLTNWKFVFSRPGIK